jgi:hypothetical protein
MASSRLVSGVILSLTFTVADLLDADAGRPSLLILVATITTSLVWHHFVLRHRAGGWTPRTLIQ